MNLIIRKRKLNDFPSLIRIAKDSFPGIRRMIYLLLPTIVAENNSQVVGFVSLANRPNQGEIILIAVNKDCRGQNIGQHLIKNAFDYLINKGKESCISKVRIDNPRALNFYKKNGFKVQRILKGFILGDVYLVKKEL